MKLIKLQDKFILVSDEEIKLNDWYLHNQKPTGLRIQHNTTNMLPMDAKKIIAGISETNTINFNGFEEELSNITTANVEVIMENNIYLITKIIKDEYKN